MLRPRLLACRLACAFADAILLTTDDDAIHVPPRKGGPLAVLRGSLFLRR